MAGRHGQMLVLSKSKEAIHRLRLVFKMAFSILVHDQFPRTSNTRDCVHSKINTWLMIACKENTLPVIFNSELSPLPRVIHCTDSVDTNTPIQTILWKAPIRDGVIPLDEFFHIRWEIKWSKYELSKLSSNINGQYDTTEGQLGTSFIIKKRV